MDVTEHHEGNAAGRPHRLPFDGPIGTSPQLITRDEELEEQPDNFFFLILLAFAFSKLNFYSSASINIAHGCTRDEPLR